MQLVDFLHDTQGFFTREQARESGYSDTQIAAAVRAGHWVRFRRGYYAYGADWRALDEVGRHRVRSRAVLHSLGPAVALSHVSATIEYGMVAWGHRLDRVHVTRLDGGAGRVEGDVVHHEGRCLADDVHELHGLRVMGPGRSAIEAASVVRNEVALCTLDSVLHLGLADHDQLMSTFVHMRHWPRTRHLHFPVRLAHAGSDGPGESRGKWLFWSHGIPPPHIQFEVYDADGVLRGTCDWGWPDHGVLGSSTVG